MKAPEARPKIQLGLHATAAGALLLAYLVAAGSMQSAKGEPGDQLQKIKLMGQVRYNRVSPPEAGVKLLEDIFMRVRSAPQVAMKTNTIAQQPQNIPQQGPTDYRLAIRPKQTGRIGLLPSPSLQLVPTETIASSRLPTTTLDSLTATAKETATPTTANSQSAASSKLRDDAPAAEAWLGNKQIVLNLPQPPHSGVWESSAVNNKVIAQAKADGNYEADSAGMSLANNGLNFRQVSPASSPKGQPESKAEPSGDSAGYYGGAGAVMSDKVAAKPRAQRATNRPPDLATATGRLFGALKNVEELQRSAGAPAALVPPPAPVAPPAAPSLAGRLMAGKVEQTSYKKLRKEQQEGAAIGGGIGLGNAVLAGKSKDAKQQVAYDEEAVPAGNELRRKRKATAIAMNTGDIALLPPNVVTGIPLIRLGISQSHAGSALMAMGNLKTQKVNKWTVLSWQRQSPTKTVPDLQLYIRNGLLDAMRIFDGSLIAPDFGINMGDDLSKVKEKFGEPAFILQEPNPGAGQNYIYPISQVGFQLARPAPNQQPRIVSVLIFNVK